MEAVRTKNFVWMPMSVSAIYELKNTEEKIGQVVLNMSLDSKASPVHRSKIPKITTFLVITNSRI